MLVLFYSKSSRIPSILSIDSWNAKMVEGDSNVNVNFNKDEVANTTDRSSALAEGISKMLTGVIRDFDSKAEDASRSQHQLSSALDRLTSQLDQLLEDAPLPFIMQHASKLSNVRKRVASLNSVLKSVQHRLDNIDRMMSVASHDNKSNIGGSN